jgi:hypothetical protein
LLLLPLHALEENENNYKLGEGIQVGSLPFYLGGYFSFDYKHSDSANRYRIDDLAILGYGTYEKFFYMAEFEFKEFYVLTESKGNSTLTQDTNLHTERLYVDYNLNENYMFRAGKYNSPIGFWNLLPVNVLRDTTSSPITSDIIFPQYTTGLALSYTSYGDNDIKIDLMAQKNSDLDAGYNNYEIDEHLGLGVTYSSDNLSLKFNTGVFNLVHYNLNKNDDNGDDDDDDKYELQQPQRYYALASAKYENDNFQIMSEIGTQASSNEFTTPYAAYIQGLYRFSDEHIAILRAEAYEEKVLHTSENIAIIGYTYRPIYPIAVKTEYQFHSISKNDNFLLSFSMMF